MNSAEATLHGLERLTIRVICICGWDALSTDVMVALGLLERHQWREAHGNGAYIDRAIDYGAPLSPSLAQARRQDRRRIRAFKEAMRRG